MSGPAGALLAAVLLLIALAGAVVRPRGWPEAAIAVPAAALAVAGGTLTLQQAGDEAARSAGVLGFLAAVLVLAQLCADEGVFEAAGTWMARVSGRDPRRLLVVVFAAASLSTAVLSLDATVVLLTPVVALTAARVGARPGPHAHACAHLSNSASLLLPVSNLTNLLAFAACGVGFLHFAALMALPWAVSIAVEYLLFRRFFAGDLQPPVASPGAARSAQDGEAAAGPAPGAPRPVFALTTLAVTLAGFAVASGFGVDPAWVACAGATVLAGHALATRRTTALTLLRAAALPFLGFVLALAVLVRALADNGAAAGLRSLVPLDDGPLTLLAVAALAAVLSNLVNNLPAALLLIPLTAPAGTGPVLATLLGVNLGPNLGYAGSLATLLWRRIAREHGVEVRLGQFTRLGLLTVPATLLGSVAALWLSLQLIGS